MIEQNVKDTLNADGALPGGETAGDAVELLEPAPADAARAEPSGERVLRPAAQVSGAGFHGPGPDIGSRISIMNIQSGGAIASADGAGHEPREVGTAQAQTTESVKRGPGPAGASAAGPGPDSGASGLEEWFETPQGRYVLNWEMARVDQVVADIFGYYAVQIGLPGIDFLRTNRVTTRFTASLRGTPGVMADAHELPFASESLDLVVLPHLLEFSSEPHQILREVERVLRPEGQVVILCFNPVSLWGVKKLFAAPPHAPWDGEFVSVLRMKDWLKLLNFEMRGGRFGCYRPPYTSEKWLGRLGFLEKAGDRWWPVAGAVYLMQAKKRVPNMRIITPSWRKQRVKAEALAPSTNGANRGASKVAERIIELGLDPGSHPGGSSVTLAAGPAHHMPGREETR